MKFSKAQNRHEPFLPPSWAGWKLGTSIDCTLPDDLETVLILKETTLQIFQGAVTFLIWAFTTTLWILPSDSRLLVTTSQTVAETSGSQLLSFSLGFCSSFLLPFKVLFIL